MVSVRAYRGGTHGSGVLSSACDMLEMSMVRGVGGVCDRIGFGPYQFWRNMGNVVYVSVFWLRWCWGREGGRLLPGSGRVVLCLCVL